MALRLRSFGQKSLGDVTFNARLGFSPSLLPHCKEVLEVFIFNLLPMAGKKQLSRGEAAAVVAEGLIEHWIFQNVYTVRKYCVVNKLSKLYDEYISLTRIAQKQRTPVWKEKKLDPFLAKMSSCFDIYCKDPDARKNQEKLYGVKMSSVEYDYVQDQMGPRLMFCLTEVEKSWAKTAARRKEEEERLRRTEQKEKKEKDEREARVEVPDDVDAAPCNEDQEEDREFTPELNPKEDESSGKKRKFEHVVGATDNTLPTNWNHLRISERKVRPEFYRVCDLLIAKYHCSMDQAVASVVEVGRGLFNLPWKFHDEGETLDLDTAPHRQSQLLASRAIEAHTLSKLAQLIAESPGNATVCLHDDGSRAQGCGGYSVSGVTLPGLEPGSRRYFPFPTLPIARETRENLAELKLTLLAILATCGGVSRQLIWSKIDFSMTDSVSHNREVEKMVADTLETEHIPSHLLCNVHPSLMFGREILGLFVEIDTTLTPDKIYAGFAIMISDTQLSVFQNCVDCTLRLVSRDYNHKAWNKAEEFELFMAPQSIQIKRLQMERFNSLVFSAATFLRVDTHVTAFLDKFEHITNQLACLVRSFQTLDYIRVLAAVVVALGSHLILPFISLTSSATTTQEKLLTAFPQLYINLTTTPVDQLLDLDSPAFDFISVERFKHSNFPEELLASARVVVQENKEQVVKVLTLLLPRLAKGWERQRGDQYGFGSCPDLECKERVSAMDQEKLKGAPVNNLDPEQSVGSINHERSVRGASQLAAASRAHVSGKGADLIKDETTDSRFRKLSGPEGELSSIMKEWNEKQDELAAQGLDSKTVANLATDRQRNNDLTELKAAGGPFTTAADVDEYLSSGLPEAKMNKRLYLEVGTILFDHVIDGNLMMVVINNDDSYRYFDRNISDKHAIRCAMQETQV